MQCTQRSTGVTRRRRKLWQPIPRRCHLVSFVSPKLAIRRPHRRARNRDQEHADSRSVSGAMRRACTPHRALVSRTLTAAASTSPSVIPWHRRRAEVQCELGRRDRDSVGRYGAVRHAEASPRWRARCRFWCKPHSIRGNTEDGQRSDEHVLDATTGLRVCLNCGWQRDESVSLGPRSIFEKRRVPVTRSVRL